MPVYEYECKKCGNQSEMLQKISDASLTECEMCHGKLKKLISQSTFHLKGTGWYVTDYASKSGANQGRSTKSETGTSSTPSKDSTDTSKKAASSSGGSDKISKKK